MKRFNKRWNIKALITATVLSTVMAGGAMAVTDIDELQTHFDNEPVTINGIITGVDRSGNEIIVADETGLITLEADNAHAFTLGDKVIATGHIENGVFGKRRYFDAEMVQRVEPVTYDPALDRLRYTIQ